MSGTMAEGGPAGNGPAGGARAPWVAALGDLVLDLNASVPQSIRKAHDNPGLVLANPGGSAANFAAWTARLDVPVRFLARVGEDTLGDALVADLARDGVQVVAVRDPERPTAVILLWVDENGERSMVISPGANHALTAGDVPDSLTDGARLLHLSGYAYFWEQPRTAAQRAVAMARKQGLWLSLDPSSGHLMERHGIDAFWRDAETAHILLPNLDEGRALTGESEAERVLEALAGRFPLVALKLGPEGALLASGDIRLQVPADTVQAVDTTGAGDAWAAAFLATLLRSAWRGPGLPPQPTREQMEEAARAGNRLAAWVVTRKGARPRGDYPRL